MIIKLTEVRNSTKELCAMYVNTDQIQYFGKSINGQDTRLKIADNGYMFVKESPEEVFAMIYPKPPLMTYFDEASEVTEEMWNKVPVRYVK